VPVAGSAAVAGALDGVPVLGIWVAVPSAMFQVDNRGKRSVTLDLRRPAARELAHVLVRRSAVFLTNLRRQGRRRARMTRLGALAAAALVGCSASLGSVGILAPQAEGTGLKLLRPAVSGRSCRASLAGLPLAAGEPDLREALAQVLALDAEANVVANAEVRWRRLVTGVYNRRCVEVRGDLARTVPTVTIPMGQHEL